MEAAMSNEAVAVSTPESAYTNLLLRSWGCLPIPLLSKIFPNIWNVRDC